MAVVPPARRPSHQIPDTPRPALRRPLLPRARMLELGRDQVPIPGEPDEPPSEAIDHENVRGPDCYLH